MSQNWKLALQGQMLLRENALCLLDEVAAQEQVYLDRYADALHCEKAPDYHAYTVTEGGQAIIDVSGVLVHKFGIDRNCWGLQGYDGIERQILQADSDPDVSEIVLDINSPGGMVFGVGEAGRVISEAEKPTIAFVNELAASGAYWLACACDEIVAIPASEIGSIGVKYIHLNAEGFYEANGLEHRVFKAGERKDMGAGFRAMTDDEAQEQQAEVDATYDRFVGWVSERRGLDESVVRGTEARVFTAERASEIGLIDRIATKDEVLNAPVTRGVGQFASEGDFEMAKPESRDEAANFDQQLADAKAGWEKEQQAKTEDAVAKAVSAAMAERDQKEAAEKDRVSAVMALDEAKGREAMAAKLAEKGLSAEDAKDVLAAAPKSYSASMDETGGAGLKVDAESSDGAPADPPKSTVKHATVAGM